jgi:ubiquinone/menaquinone biosynthesis C-methylase UbiE
MYKNQFSELNKNYNNHLYSGFLGYLFKKNHLLMEKNSNQLINKKNIILEIGGGTYPHINYLKHPFEEYYSADIDENNELSNFYKKNYPKIRYQKFDGKYLPYENNFFDRVIISHCLEHINNPEKFLSEMIRVCKESGIISIALPTDPAVAWRLGRFFIKKIIQKKTHKLSDIDYDYVNAIEHVNSIFNLRTILKKKFNIISEIYYPFNVKIIDINLFYIVDIVK